MSAKPTSRSVPAIRVKAANERPADPAAGFVLYWMTAYRRTTWNFSLDRALEWAKELRRPLVVLESLTSGGRWASDRHHAFVLQGMTENAAACERAGVRYYPHVELKQGDSIDLAVALAQRACVVVIDEFPIKRVTQDQGKVAERSKVLVERVDSNGLLPLRAAAQAFPTAYAFRRFLQRTLPDHLIVAPKSSPFARLKLPVLRGLPRAVTGRWPAASSKLLAAVPASLARLPIDHRVGRVDAAGGPSAARKRLKRFLEGKLASYPRDRSQPGVDGTSGLSPYLHFGQVSVHQIFHELARHEGWSPDRLAQKATGKREGWWGMSQAAEAFLDELVTWREIGFNMCALRSDYNEYDSLPDWARQTLADHMGDPREHVYSYEEFEGARTHDPLWNAAQTEIVRTGRMHNYLRMLWGKKILEWTRSPGEALAVMIELNNKYGLDGQDPNSYSGIFWVLGRYDRPWGPERPIFGKIRYMSSENTARKLRLGDYLEKHSPGDD